MQSTNAGEEMKYQIPLRKLPCPKLTPCLLSTRTVDLENIGKTSLESADPMSRVFRGHTVPKAFGSVMISRLFLLALGLGGCAATPQAAPVVTLNMRSGNYPRKAHSVFQILVPSHNGHVATGITATTTPRTTKRSTTPMGIGKNADRRSCI